MAINEPGWLAGRGQAIAVDPEFVLSARHAAFKCLIEAADRCYLIDVREGRKRLTA